jgi:hypothetical protein
MAKAEANIANGYFFPTPEAARALIKSLKKAVANDPDLAKRLKANPRKVLGDHGFAREVQDEFLRESGGRVVATEGSCACTGCCATSSLCCGTM